MSQKEITGTLSNWIGEGMLASRAEDYANDLRRNEQSFYHKTLVQHGTELQRRCVREFAASIESTARGMLALAEIDREENRIVHCVGHEERSPFPQCSSMTGISEMVIVLNPDPPGCGCQAPEHGDIFAPWGSLGLIAVTLQVGRDAKGGIAAQLGLVLPLRGRDAPEEGFAIVTFDRVGHGMPHTYRPRLVKGTYLQYTLGLIPKEEIAEAFRSMGGGIDSAVGFPDATRYLGEHLPHLGQYFTELAKKLDASHTH